MRALFWNFTLKLFIWVLAFVSNKAKCESQNGGNKKAKHAKFSEKQTFLTPWYARTCVYQGVRDIRFSEYLACFAFLLPPFEIRSFALLPTIYWDIASGNYIWIFYLRRNWDQQIQNCFCVRLQSFIYNPVEHLRWLILLSPVDSICRKAPS